MEETIKARYYTVKEIKQMEHCGKDKAYSIAKSLDYEKRGRDIYVFADSYESYYKEKRQKAHKHKEEQENQNNQAESNIYRIRKFI